jgi:1,2-diacylglycerol 3-beta-galactosyltransferase
MEDTSTQSTRFTILFLLADTGAGHRSAAHAIFRAMGLLVAESNQSNQSNQVTCGGHYLDVFAACGGFPIRSWSRLYGWSIAHVPRAYGLVFHLTNHPMVLPLLEGLLYRLLQAKLAVQLREIRPDVVVCVHPLLGRVALRVLAEAQLDAPFVAVMTDLVTPHRGWTAPGLRHCVVPTEAVREFCQRNGVRDERIEVLGMPIDARFGKHRKGAAVAALGLDPAVPVILMVGGGAPARRFLRLVRAVWRSALPAQVLIVTGRDQRLRRRLTGMKAELAGDVRRRTRILGFARNMPRLMAAADVLVTKAGPSTICEAIASKVPILLLGCVPGQEEGNVGYVRDHGIGLVAATPASLLQALEECLQPKSALAESMRANMAELQNPRAAPSIAAYILSILGISAGAGAPASRPPTETAVGVTSLRM